MNPALLALCMSLAFVASLVFVAAAEAADYAGAIRRVVCRR